MSCSWNTWDLWLAISSYLGRFPRAATPWFLPCFLALSTAKLLFDSVSLRWNRIRVVAFSNFSLALFFPNFNFRRLKDYLRWPCANGNCIFVTNSRYVSFHSKREGRWLSIKILAIVYSISSLQGSHFRRYGAISSRAYREILRGIHRLPFSRWKCLRSKRSSSCLLSDVQKSSIPAIRIHLYRLEFGTFVKCVKDRRWIERNFFS